MLQTEYEFTLPCGFVDDDGTLHREGVMRLSTALDEVEAAQDARGRANDTYLSILLLARVITRLGTIAPVGVDVVERLANRCSWSIADRAQHLVAPGEQIRHGGHDRHRDRRG